jgi:hypothetical protein
MNLAQKIKCFFGYHNYISKYYDDVEYIDKKSETINNEIIYTEKYKLLKKCCTVCKECSFVEKL